MESYEDLLKQKEEIERKKQELQAKSLLTVDVRLTDLDLFQEFLADIKQIMDMDGIPPYALERFKEAVNKCLQT